jgi:hypothetical protein
MSTAPVSDEIAGALGRYFFGGAGPRHSALTDVFLRAGYGHADPYVPTDGTPNKEIRVQLVVREAIRHPAGARKLVEGLLTALRLHGSFDKTRTDFDLQLVRTTQTAFRRAGWSMSDDGILSALGQIDLQTGGREALDEQIDRLRRSTDDAGQALGSAKDLLEAVAKFVLEELGWPHDGDFNKLWYMARDRLGVHPAQLTIEGPGAAQVKKILGATWTIAEQVNELRNLQGAGHGRTLPTGVTTEMALMVVREACSVAQFMLANLDRVVGR